ncbi:LysR family transcriptional regulator [Streptomyces winkii]|uniref:LysR family transcriptional regulator n=1 Tax=Streptomyces winkii TaxID=3051178 RepID=UPI0028D8C5DF|nr:LysR family transcriptional regulator [Streptomyces sp. DSM 40971]
MEVRWLETFTAVAKEGSMAAAADSLGYARSTVTGHVQSLERHLGARLFDRGRTGQPLSTAGAALLDHAEAVLDRLYQARLAVTNVLQGSLPALPLGATDSLAEYRLPVFLRMLSRFLPDLKVEVSTAAARQLVEGIEKGTLPIALVNGLSDEPPPDGRGLVGRRRLWEENAVLVCSPVRAQDPRRILVTAQGCVYRQLVEEEFLDRLPQPDILQVGSLSGVKSSALSGLGVGLLPMVAAKPYLNAGQLVELPLRTARTVVTDVLWHQETCPSKVVEHLRRLRPTPGTDLG